VGLDANGVRFLLFAKGDGVDFTRTATLGRQQLFLDAPAFQQYLVAFGASTAKDHAEALLRKGDGYAEPLLELLGASEVASLDASDYEHATHRVDLNSPLPDPLRGRFTAVLDGGTLEHVFNFPAAIRNGMDMVAIGGHFLAITPANNFFGHGFYQFSPELFFRIFSAANGFSLRRMIAFEDRPDADWFEVVDPAVAGERVILVNATPTYLVVIARKDASVPVFATPPLQSDYVSMWDAGGRPASGEAPGSLLSRVRGHLPAPAKRLYARLRQAAPVASLGASKFFKPLRMPR
jgi:hypothetical protein